MTEKDPTKRITLEELLDFLNTYIGPTKFINERQYVRIFEEKMNVDNRSDEEKDVYYVETAGTYMRIGWYNKAIEFFKLSLEIKKKLGIEKGLKAAYIMSDIGQSYQYMRDLEKSFFYLSKAQTILLNLNPFDPALGNILRQKGRISDLRGAFDESLEYYEKSQRFFQNLEENDKTNYRLKISQLMVDKGRIYLQLGLGAEALEVAEEGI